MLSNPQGEHVRLHLFAVLLTWIQAIFDKLPESITQPSESVESKKRRQESLPQSSRPHLFKHDSDFIATSPRRAQTFPESTAGTKRTALPLSQAHLANLGVDPAYHSPSQSTSELFETPSLTPTSVTASSLSSYGMAAGPTHPARPGQPFPVTHNYADHHSGLSVPLSDINTMMFPTADPMQYPNQAMTTFEDTHPQAFVYKHGSPNMAVPYHPASGVEIKPGHPAYSGLGNVPIGQRRPDNEVQLLGPMPMYLMQGAQHRGFHPPPGMPHPAQIPSQDGGNMSFDELFSGEEWAQTFMDQGLGLSGNGSASAPYPKNAPYGPGGPGMGSWH